MTPYIERDTQGDMTIRDADTNDALCYMPSTSCRTATAKYRREVEARAELILAALTPQASPAQTGDR